MDLWLTQIIGSIVFLAMVAFFQCAMAYALEPERHSLRSWLVRAAREPRDPKKTKELKQFLTDLVLAIFFGVAPFPVFWKWLGWLFCFCALLYILQSAIDSINERPLKTRLLGGGILVVVFIVGFWSSAKAMWMQQKSNALTGEICSLRSGGICYTPPIPTIEIGGDSGSKLVYVGAEDSVDFGKFARNAGLIIERGKHGMEITTPVLDRSGRRIANVEKNLWTVVSQPEISDKNYTDNALEIRDSRGDVVLQLRYLPDRLQIAAE